MTLPSLTLIPAGAGSGKTRALEERLTAWVREGKVEPHRIAAVTFTEAAAAELRERLRAALLRDGRPEAALALERAYISTIHGFGLRILRELAFEAGGSPDPRLLAEDEERVLVDLELARTKRTEHVLEDLPRFGYRYDHGSGRSPEDVFRDRVRAVLDRLRWIGGVAGERELASHAAERLRTCYGPTAPAGALETKLVEAARALLERFPSSLEGSFPENQSATEDFRRNFRSLSEACDVEPLRRRWTLWKELAGLRTKVRGGGLPEGYAELAEAVKEAAARLPEHPGPLEDAVHHVQALLGAATEALASYGEAKRQRGLVDYTDMVAGAAQLLASRPQGLEALRGRLDCLVVDEFQDTNPLQFTLLWRLHWAGVPMLVVGDVKQAIMGFQGADERLLEALTGRHPEATRPLRENRRSQAPLMAFLNRAGESLFGSGYTPLEPKAPYESRLEPLEAIVAAGKVRDGEADLRAAVALRVRELLEKPGAEVWDRHLGRRRPIRGSDVGVLARSHAEIDRLAGELRRAGVRVRLAETEGWLASRPVQLARHALVFVADPGDTHAALYLAVTELGEHGLEEALARLAEGRPLRDAVLERLRPVAAGPADRSVATLLWEVLEALSLFDAIARWPEVEKARANLLRLVAEAEHFSEMHREALEASRLYGSGAKTFLAWLEKRADEDDAQPHPRVRDEEAVEIVTWHKAKGREWPVVVVTSLDDDVKVRLPDLSVDYRSFEQLDDVLDEARIEITPDFEAKETKERFEEALFPGVERTERRLLYVAMTRAREKLVLAWPAFLQSSTKRNRTLWGLLRGSGVDLDGDALVAGGARFPCDRIDAGGASARLEEAASGEEDPEGLPVLGRCALRPVASPSGLTPETVVPSSLRGRPGDPAEAFHHDRYADPLEEIAPALQPAERGDLLHRALEVRIGHPERRDAVRSLLEGELTEAAADRTLTAFEAFEAWLQRALAPKAVRTELPLLALDEGGSVVNGTLDLLAETEEGLWILDHKSDAGPATPSIPDLTAGATAYLPQLRAYADALRAAAPDRPVAGLALHWIAAGTVSLLPLRRGALR